MKVRGQLNVSTLPLVAKAAIRSKAEVLLLMIYCFYAPIVCGGSVFVIVLVWFYFMSYLVLQPS